MLLRVPHTADVQTPAERSHFREKLEEYKRPAEREGDTMEDGYNFSAMSRDWERYYRSTIMGTAAAASFRRKTARQLVAYFKGRFLQRTNAITTMANHREDDRALAASLRSGAGLGPAPPRPQPLPRPPLRPPSSSSASSGSGAGGATSEAAPGSAAAGAGGGGGTGAGEDEGRGAAGGEGGAAAPGPVPAPWFPGGHMVAMPPMPLPRGHDQVQLRLAAAAAVARDQGPQAGVAHMFYAQPSLFVGGGAGRGGRGLGSTAGGSGQASSSSSVQGGGGGDGRKAGGGGSSKGRTSKVCKQCGHRIGNWRDQHPHSRKRKAPQGEGAGGGGDGEGNGQEDACLVRIPDDVQIPKPKYTLKWKGKCRHPGCMKCDAHLCELCDADDSQACKRQEDQG